MERLTEKVSNDIVENEYVYEPYIALYEPHKSIAQKLGKLEDLEEEIGCPLEVLFRALQQEEVYTTFSKEPKHLMIENRFGKYLIYDKEWLIELKDYKKTWWLKPDKSE